MTETKQTKDKKDLTPDELIKAIVAAAKTTSQVKRTIGDSFKRRYENKEKRHEDEQGFKPSDVRADS